MWLLTPNFIPWAFTAAASSPTTSRIGPILAAFQVPALPMLAGSELSHIANRSWCCAVAFTNVAPDALNSAAQDAALVAWWGCAVWFHVEQVNCAMKSL